MHVFSSIMKPHQTGIFDVSAVNDCHQVHVVFGSPGIDPAKKAAELKAHHPELSRAEAATFW